MKRTRGRAVAGATVLEALELRQHFSVSDAPSNLTITKLSENQLTLNWRDNCKSEVGYQVMRSADAGLTWKTAGRVAAGAKSFVANGLAAGASYRFRVRGELLGAKFTGFSPSITTQMVPLAPAGFKFVISTDEHLFISWPRVFG